MAFNLRGGLLRNLIGIGVAIALGLGWWAFSSFKEKASAPDVGECVTVSGSITDADVDEADCGDDDVLYKVTDDDGDCDEDAEVNYTVEVNGSDAVDLCLAWDVEVGDCVSAAVASIEKLVDCATTKNDPNVLKVTSIEDDATAKCAKKDELPIVNEKRDELICVGANV